MGSRQRLVTQSMSKSVKRFMKIFVRRLDHRTDPVMALRHLPVKEFRNKNAEMFLVKNATMSRRSIVEPSHDSSAEMSHLRFAITFRVRFQGKIVKRSR